MLERGGGSLIFTSTSTFVGYTAGMPGVAAYAASKAGLIGLMKSLATKFGPKGIRVNALLPGGTGTPMAEASVSTPEALAFVENLHVLKRRASPEEIAVRLFIVPPMRRASLEALRSLPMAGCRSTGPDREAHGDAGRVATTIGLSSWKASR
jgi:NAD(P)-dependent dehydrogenase (short-subunit alcohol dehydrogenase family)